MLNHFQSYFYIRSQMETLNMHAFNTAGENILERKKTRLPCFSFELDPLGWCYSIPTKKKVFVCMKIFRNTLSSNFCLTACVITEVIWVWPPETGGISPRPLFLAKSDRLPVTLFFFKFQAQLTTESDVISGNVHCSVLFSYSLVSFCTQQSSAFMSGNLKTNKRDCLTALWLRESRFLSVVDREP